MLSYFFLVKLLNDPREGGTEVTRGGQREGEFSVIHLIVGRKVSRGMGPLKPLHRPRGSHCSAPAAAAATSVAKASNLGKINPRIMNGDKGRLRGGGGRKTFSLGPEYAERNRP